MVAFVAYRCYCCCLMCFVVQIIFWDSFTDWQNMKYECGIMSVGLWRHDNGAGLGMSEKFAKAWEKLIEFWFRKRILTCFFPSCYWCCWIDARSSIWIWLRQNIDEHIGDFGYVSSTMKILFVWKWILGFSLSPLECSSCKMIHNKTN